MNKFIKSVSLILLTFLLFGCSGTPTQTTPPQEVVPTDAEAPGDISTSETLTTPVPNENGLTIEENEIVRIVDLDSLTFTPVNGSQEAILERHAAEKGERYSFGIEIVIDNGGHQYKAVEEAGTNGSLLVSLLHDGEIIFQVDAGDGSPISPLQGLWVDDGHWTLEIAYITTTTVDNTIYTEVIGQVYRDGVSLNEQYGYEEIFGYQLLDDKPFFFYKLDGKIHLSYDGETLPIWYDEVHHYSCCSGAMLNPRMGSNWVSFWGEREGVMYYTEIGKY